LKEKLASGVGRDMQGVRMKKLENRIDKLYDVSIKEVTVAMDLMRLDLESYMTENNCEVFSMKKHVENLVNIRKQTELGTEKRIKKQKGAIESLTGAIGHVMNRFKSPVSEGSSRHSQNTGSARN